MRDLADELEKTAGADGLNGTTDDDLGAAPGAEDDAAPGADDDNQDDAAAAAAGNGTPDGDDLPGDEGGDGGGPDGGMPQALGDQDTDDTAQDLDGADDDATDPGAPDDSEFGEHNVEPGHHVAFSAGAFSGQGKVTATGDDGATVKDKTGREHRVHWHEITGHSDAAASAGATPAAGKKPGQP